MAKLKLLSLRLHWGAPACKVKWSLEERDAIYNPPPHHEPKEVTVMTGLSMRFGGGFIFFGFQYLRDRYSTVREDWKSEGVEDFGDKVVQ